MSDEIFGAGGAPQWKDAARDLAIVLKSVAAGRISATDAIAEVKAWPEGRWPVNASPFEEAFHFLYHFEADADIRAKDDAYAAEQVRTLEEYAASLDTLAADGT